MRWDASARCRPVVGPEALEINSQGIAIGYREQHDRRPTIELGNKFTCGI